MCRRGSSHAALAEPEEDYVPWRIAAFFHQHAFDHVPPDHVHSLLEAGIEVHLPGSRVELEIVAPVEASEIEGERCGCLKRYGCCLRERELGAKRSEGGFIVAEAVQEKEDVDGLLGRRGWSDG